jgi:hypothetical protein
MTYCSPFDLSRPNWRFSSSCSCGVAWGTLARFVTALPGASRKSAKLIVIATNTVTIANATRLMK